MFRLLISLIALPPLVACSRCSQGSDDRSDAAGTAPSAGQPASTRAALEPMRIPPGAAHNGAWTNEFRMERFAGDDNFDWRSARALCQEKNLELCIETQWERACALHPHLGELESWTLSVQGVAAVVRGGNGSCTTRALRAVEDRSSNRASFCCSRAVALKSDDVPESVRVQVSRRLLELEATLFEPNLGALGSLLADKLTIDAEETPRDDAVTKLVADAKDEPQQRLSFELCTQRKLDEQPSREVFECSVVLAGASKLRSMTRRVAFEDENGALNHWSDPKKARFRAKKERVRAFLPSE